MNILAIDSTADQLVITACKASKIATRISPLGNKRHNGLILQYIDEVLGELEMSVEDIDFYGCVVGAGSFTGIRIGVSTIKALSFATGKKAVAITSFETGAYNEVGDFVVAIDCRHDNYYAGFFDGSWQQMHSVGGYTMAELENSGKRIIFKTEPSSDIALLEITKDYAQKGIFNALEPLYLRKSQAERERDGE